MLAAAVKRLAPGVRVTKSTISRPARRFTATSIEDAAKPLVEKFLAESASAPRVNAVAAKLAWEKEAGVFVDLRTSNYVSIEGFERIPMEQLAKSLAKIEGAATAANTKDIYFLDSTGYLSGQAVNLLAEFPQFAGYNVRAIEGGLPLWMDDKGPFSTPNADLNALLQKGREEKSPAQKQFFHQLGEEVGFVPPKHEMLILEEGSNIVTENPLVVTPSTDRTAFRKFVERLKF